MYNKLLLIFAALLACCPFMAADVANDTIYNPNIIYSGMPKTYEIAGIKVTGADNYEDYIIIAATSLMPPNDSGAKGFSPRCKSRWRKFAAKKRGSKSACANNLASAKSATMA